MGFQYVQCQAVRFCLAVTLVFCAVWTSLSTASATPFTMNVPGTSLALPTAYPAAGGVAIVLVGANGNAYFQFSNPTGAFQGYQNSGTPAAFQGNPFTINSPINLDCGFSPCADYFGGSVANIYIRFTAYDGDTQVGGFDQNDITLRLNGFDVANWSSITTEITNNAGTQSFGTEQGFGNNTLNTGWFTSTNAALAANILSTGRTTSQVFDRDPNDNYWDFRIGSTLTNNDIVTVAPGYTLTKVANRTTFAAVGDVITYTYEVTNIGSVPIRNLQVSDNKIIGAITCAPTVLMDVNAGEIPNKAICTKTYTVTQADLDAQKVTNIAKAIGTPDFGTLGERTATATVTGPALAPAIDVLKTSSLTVFGAVGTSVPYNFRIQNTGNTTLTSVVVTDAKIPGLSCTFATLIPGAVQNCSGSYTVKQSDIDSFATGTRLVNTAAVTARDPRNLAVTDTTPASLTVSLPGPASAPAITMTKVAQVATFDAVGTVIPYRITLTNSGNVTWPAAPAVTDPLATVTCPVGTVAPGAAIVCLANFAVTQANLNAGKVDNTASATITVAGVVANATASASVNATRRTTLLLDKRLSLTSPTSYAATGVALIYSYDLTNTGNVTLNTVSVTDNKVAVTCPVATLAPAATTTCTSAAYPTTQADLNAGSVVNVATANATAAVTNAAVASNNDTVSVPAVQSPAISLTKSAPIPALKPKQYTVGRVVTYSYTVENTGNVQILAANQIRIVDDKAGTFDCGTGTLDQGASRICTQAYTLTAADINAGFVINKATATAGSVATSNQATATIAPDFAPGLTLVKTADVANVDATTDVITYTFTLTNSGDSTIVKSSQPITVVDPAVSAASCVAAQPATLGPNASYTCAATYLPTQAQLNAGIVRNTATASFPFNATTTISAPSSSVNVPVIELPGLDITKAGPAQFTTVGSTVTFTFGARNTGNVTLTDVVITDPKIPALSCTFASIPPGPTPVTCTGNYTVTQANVDTGEINNTATGQGRTAQGGTANDTASTMVPINPANSTKAATLTKTANRTTFTAVNDTIVYTMAVANTGTRTLSGITVTDALDPTYTCAIPTLAPGLTNSLCQLTYRVTQADVNRGNVVNLASAASADFATLTSTRTVTGPARTANYVFTKTANGGFTAAGNVVTFTLAARNSGNTTLTNVVITDAFFNPDLSCTVPTLEPGLTNNTCTGSYTVTQADVDAGSITNTANATASAPAGVTAPAPKTATAVVNGPTRAPKVTIAKTTTGTTYGATGTTKTFNFSVTNTGNVTLSSLRVQDTALGFDCLVANLAPGASTSSCATPPGPLSATKTISQADVDAGAYTNVAKVTGTSLIGAIPVTAEAQVTLIGPAQIPALSVVKDSTSVPFTALGQAVDYTYTVQNTGNITLTAPITVADNKITAVTCPALPPAGLAPLATITCTGTYRVTQADLNTGSVTNSATASISQPVVPVNFGDPSFTTVTSAPVNKTVSASQLPALSLDKRVKASSVSSYSATNGVFTSVTFEYVVTNTGNVTTTAPVTIADDKISGTLTCAPLGLAPGASATCEQVWTADQAALDAGSVTNIGVATTVFGGTPRNSAPDSATVTAVQRPSLMTVKTFVSNSGGAAFNAGDVLSYTIDVTNNGNVSIVGPIALTDSLTNPVCPAQAPGFKLAPNATLACTATHTVTVNDLDLGAATNVVFATGSFNALPVKSPSDDAIYPLDRQPALSLTKAAAPGSSFDGGGDVVVYSYTVKNSGNVGLSRDIFVSDDKFSGPQLCRAASLGPFASASPPGAGNGATHTCTLNYTVVQADVDRGFVTNNATVNTIFGPLATPTNVVSPNAAATVLGVTTPALTVDKVVATGPSPALAGSVLTYRITTTNSGNQTISGVAVADPKVGPLVCTVGGSPAPSNVVLAPLGVLICTASYTVKQSDIDAQVLTNTATARGSNPQGGTVTGADTVIHPLPPAAASVEVTKVITPAPGPDDAYSNLGQAVTFVVTVRNTGNITLTSTQVTDDLVPGPCAVGPLAPGAADSSCTYTYLVKQSDLDRQFGTAPNFHAGFVNTATAVAQPANPGAPTVTDQGDVFAKGPAQQPALSLIKEALTADFDAVGDILTYRYVVANTGNVTLLVQPTVFDNKIPTVACDPIPALGLAPGGFVNCTATYTVSQADVDAGKVTNIANVSSTEVSPSPNVTVTVDGIRSPGIVIVKTPSVLTNAKVGDVIAYTYRVTNTGNVSLTAITLADNHTSAAGTAALAIGGDTLTTDQGVPGNSTDGAGSGVWSALGPGDTVSFTAAYTVTQADVNAGAALANTVSVTSGSPSGTTPPADSQTVTVRVATPTPVMVVIKTANTAGLSTPPVVGNQIAYTITVRNAGNVTLDTVVLTETFVDAKGVALSPKPVPVLASGDTDNDAKLDVTETWTYTASFSLNQQAIDAGGVSNQVVAAARDPFKTPVTDTSDDNGVGASDPTVTALAANARIAVAKAAVPAFGSNARADAGDTITYTYTVTNPGNVTLFDVGVVETGFTGTGTLPVPLRISGGVNLGGNPAIIDLAVGGTATYRVAYTLTQADIESGAVTNQATVTAKDPAGIDRSDTSGATAGDNTATVTALPRVPSMTTIKTANVSGLSTPPVAGNVINYTVTVKNTGNLTLRTLITLDTLRDGLGEFSASPTLTLVSGDNGDGLLQVSETWTYTASYTLTQMAVDTGRVSNSVLVRTTDLLNNPVTDTSDNDGVGASDPTVTTLSRVSTMKVVKTANTAGLSTPPRAGNVVPFTITAANTGNVTLKQVVLADTFTRRDGTVLALTPVLTAGDAGVAGELEVAEVWTYTGSYTLVQADIDAGGISNTALVTSRNPANATISDRSDDGDNTDGNTTDDPTVLNFPNVPGLTLVKTLASGSTAPFITPGQVLAFDLLLTNTGNISLTAPITIADALVTGAGGVVNCPTGTLAPAATRICAATYTVTQADVDRGSVLNTATASVTQPVVPTVPGGPTSILVTTPASDVTASATRTPAFTIDKRIKAGSATSYAAVNDVVTFEYVVTNTGNVTIAGPVTIADNKIAGSLICSATSLAPAASVTCEQNWIATQADLNAGSVTNLGVASGNFGGAPVASPSDSVTITAVQNPSLAFDKTLIGATPPFFDEGSRLDYSFVVTNNGNVTIQGPITVADSITTVACDATPVGGLVPGNTLTCTASYLLKPGDIAQGATTNVATASGAFNGAPVTSPSDNAIYPVGATPVLSVVKESVPANVTFAAVGDVVTYRYTVTNAGRVGFSEDITITDNKLAASFVCRPKRLGIFNVGATAQCEATYLVTQADLDAEEVVNEASAVSIFAPQTVNEITVTSPVATKTVPSVPNPKLTLVKDVVTGPAQAALGDALGYRIVVTNTGNQTISGVSISDPPLVNVVCTLAGNPIAPNLIMAPGDVVTCLGSYTVTQANVDTQVLTNTATVAGNDPQGAPVTASGTDVHGLLIPENSVEVTKVLLPDPGAAAAFTAPGQGLTFAVTVKNTGKATLNAINVTDNRVSGTCAIATLAPGAADATCRFTYTTTQADMDAAFGAAPVTGGFTNVASVTAQPANPGAVPVTDTGDVFVKGPDQAPAFGLQKSSNVTTAAAYGDQITFTYVVTNRGNITLTAAPRVADDKIANVTCNPLPAAGIAPLGTVSCSGIYSVTQADVDGGGVTNIASVVSDQVTTPATDSATIAITPLPAIELTKVPSIAAGAKLGDVITYTYTARNSGNTTLTAITLADQHTSAAGTVALAIAGDALKTDQGEQGNSTDAAADGIWDRLGPGDEVTFTARYRVTQADVDAGAPLSNTATVGAAGPAGTTPPVDDAIVSVPMATAAPALTAVKLVDRATLSSPPVAGDVLNFTITLANTGNVTMTTVALVDRLRRTDGTVLALATGPIKTTGDGGVIGAIEVGEVWTYTASYTLIQADIDAGGVSNQVDATATGPSGAPARDLSDDGIPGGLDDPTLVQIPASPGIAGEKTLAAGPVTLGSTVEFLITATNTGNVTLTSVAVASDTLTRSGGAVLTLATGPTFTGASAGSGLGVLKPGEVASYSATYVLVQEDIDAGGIANSATLTGTPPLGGPIADVTDDGDDTDGNTTNDATALPITAAPSLALVKRLATGSGPTFYAVGQVLNFEFSVTNSGNVTITVPITVADPLITAAGGAVACAAPPLAPGATLLCSGSYTVKQSDLDTGQVTNVATASAGPTVSAPATREVPAQQLPAMTVVKRAQPVTATDFFTGAVVDYSYTVTNSGNITLTAPITISDNRIATSAILCPALPVGGLPPAGVLVCAGSYTVTAADVDIGSVTNLATATDGTTVSPLVSETIPDAGVPLLAIAKVADAGATFDEIGDTVGYTYRVTNNGTRAFAAPIAVIDDRLGTIACFTPNGANPDLTAGESVTCTATHVVTQADLDAGQIINQAYARTTFGAGSGVVVTELATVNVAAALLPALTLTKTSRPNPVATVGQVVTYALVATNSGNQTLRNIEVSDPKLPELVCAAGVLLRGQVLSCEGTVTVTQADVDRATLVNTAAVAGINPQGGPVGDTATETTQMPTPAPALDLVKTATPTPFGAVGSNLTYQLAVTNTGNMTMANIVVTDPMVPSFRCVIPTLPPGVRDASCAFSLPVTQANVDAGSITNTAAVTGDDPFGTTVGDSATLVTAGPARLPGLEAVKLVLPSGSALGSAVRYQVLVRNTGNVSLTVATPVDTMTRLNNTATALDAPFVRISGDTDGDDFLDLAEVWIFAATHTLAQDDIDAGGISNSVVVNATAPNGAGVSDTADNGDDTDGNTIDDPTVFEIARTPALTATKTVLTQTGTAVDDTVTFGITAVNTGNSTITDIAVADTLRRADGAIFDLTPEQISGGTTLIPGAQAEWTLTYTLTQADIDAGGFENSATVTGSGPSGETVRDVSTDGDGTDGNVTNDPTVVVIVPAPALEVIKTLVSAGSVAGEEAVFTITATNRGNVTLSGVAVVDTLTRNGGPDVGPVNVAFASSTGTPPSAAGTLKVGEAASYTARYVLIQDDINAGGLSNSAAVTANSPLGALIRDTSDNDGTGSSDPTPAPIVGRPSFSVVKSASAVQMQFPTVDKVTFTLTVQNSGNTTQTGIQLVDDLAAFVAPAVLRTDSPVVVRATGFADGTANSAYNGTSVIETLSGNATLQPGQTGTVEIDLVYSTAAGQPGGQNIGRATSDQLTTPIPSNPVTVTSPDTDGDGVSDALEGTGDRDGDGIPDAQDYDPTGAFYCEDTGQLLSGGRISVTGPSGTQSGVGTSNNITIVRDGTDGRFQFFVTAAGSYTLNISYPPGGAASTTRLTLGALDATSLLPSNPGSVGSNEDGTTGRLVDFTAGGNQFYTTFVVGAGDPHIINNNIPMTSCADTPDVRATKTADRSSARFGETVNFTLVFENNTALTYAAASFVDLLPEGLIYAPGTATLNGVATEPAITGKRLVWGPRDVPPADRTTIRLAARVVANGSAGSITNRAQLEDSTGVVQSNVAAATIRIVPEAVFDCSDVIGKVFDDKNRNGYQDRDDRDDRSALTNDDIYVGKYGNKFAPPIPEPKGEPGLPGVRLATVNGLLITTDEYGRYHVPCAAMPRDIGSNFTLKVDPRSLPSGYMLTTENPRVLRLTAGKVAKMNFGATLSNVVDIDLTASAFAAGSADPKPAFASAVAQLVQTIRSTPSVLRLGYLLKSGEDRDGAETRLMAAEKVIRDAWRGVGMYKLEIEKSIKRVQ